MQLMPCFCALCPPMLTGSCCRHFPKHGQLPPRSPSISFSLSRGFLGSKRSLQSLKQAQPRRAEASAPLGQGQFSTSGRWKSVDQCSSPPILQWHDSEHGWLLLHDLNWLNLRLSAPLNFVPPWAPRSYLPGPGSDKFPTVSERVPSKMSPSSS